MLEKALEENTAALTANTAALLGTKPNDAKPAKTNAKAPAKKTQKKEPVEDSTVKDSTDDSAEAISHDDLRKALVALKESNGREILKACGFKKLSLVKTQDDRDKVYAACQKEASS